MSKCIHVLRSFILILFGILLFTSAGMAQQKVQVVTKTVIHDLKNLLDSGVVVHAKKAVVEVTGWDKDYIQVELNLIAKHPKKETAEKELDFIQYEILKKRDHYLIKNLFYATNGRTKVKSSLNVSYKLFVPAYQKVVILNEYGSTNLRNLYGAIDLKLNFNEIRLDRIFGLLRAELSYCDLIGNSLDGTIDLNLKRSDLNLQDFAGEVLVQSSFGHTELSPSPLLRSLNVRSKSGQVKLNVNSIETFNYDVKVNASYITLPDPQQKFLESDLAGENHFFNLKNGLGKATISIVNQLDIVKITSVQSNVSNR